MKACNIFAAGEPECPADAVRSASLTIAADRGWSYARALGIWPELLVGDFDSLGEVPQGVEIIRHPVQKDDTDTLLALKIGLERGCDTFYLYGCTGGRLDHTLANLQALHFLVSHGARGFLIGRECATVICNEALRFSAAARGTVSVFALGGTACGVSLSGLLYPLDHAVLTSDFPLGVSNEFTGVPATVSVTDGLLTVLWQDTSAWPEIFRPD